MLDLHRGKTIHGDRARCPTAEQQHHLDEAEIHETIMPWRHAANRIETATLIIIVPAAD